jgi:hypothetical protein
MFFPSTVSFNSFLPVHHLKLKVSSMHPLPDHTVPVQEVINTFPQCPYLTDCNVLLQCIIPLQYATNNICYITNNSASQSLLPYFLFLGWQDSYRIQ